MRIAHRDLTIFKLSRRIKKVSDYVGHVTEPAICCISKGQLYVADDSVVIQQYGLKAESMYYLNVDEDIDIRNADIVTVYDTAYNVKSVKKYCGFKTALLERAEPERL